MEILVQLLTAIPMMLSLRYVLKRQIDKAFLNVYLPTMLLSPTYMGFQIPHMPPVGMGEGALIPIGVALLIQNLKHWSLSRLDVWILAYTLGEGLSELLHTSFPTASFVVFAAICSPGFCYVAGKQLIEQENIRVQTVRRIVIVLVLLILPVLYEYRMAQNPYLILRNLLYPGSSVGWRVQMRGGHARTAGPYGHPILAGMMFAAGLVFNTWLRYAHSKSASLRTTIFARLQRFYIPSMCLLLALILTRSRGPLLGAAVAILIAQIARFKNVRLVSSVVLGIMVLGAIVGYGYMQQYTGAYEAKDEQQGSAIYRRQLLDNYAPIVKEGGWFGWGVTEWPRVPGQESIDNQFLFLEVTQGRFGLIMFLLIGAETLYSYGKAIARARNKDDLMFAFSMLGIVAGLYISLLTVFAGAHVEQLILLLAGWSASVKVNEVAAEKTERPGSLPMYAFRRVIT